jgi:Ulp1 family protease
MGERKGWKVKEIADLPQQKNIFDCGVFTLLFARCVVEGRPINFEQPHIPFYRRKIAFDILTNNKEPRPKKNQVNIIYLLFSYSHFYF